MAEKASEELRDWEKGSDLPSESDSIQRDGSESQDFRAGRGAGVDPGAAHSFYI